MNLEQLFSMGGYGIYIWPAYLITLFIFGLNVLITFTEKKQIKQLIKEYLSKTS